MQLQGCPAASSDTNRVRAKRGEVESAAISLGEREQRYRRACGGEAAVACDVVARVTDQGERRERRKPCAQSLKKRRLR